MVEELNRNKTIVCKLQTVTKPQPYISPPGSPIMDTKKENVQSVTKDESPACHHCGDTRTIEVWFTRGWPYGENRIVACVKDGRGLRPCGSKYSEPCPEDERHRLPEED